eukprot:6191193-Pleurochrysis_carterae.AAC.1
MPMLAYGVYTTLQASAVLFGCPHRILSLDHKLTCEPRLPRDAQIETDRGNDPRCLDELAYTTHVQVHSQLCTRPEVHYVRRTRAFSSPPFATCIALCDGTLPKLEEAHQVNFIAKDSNGPFIMPPDSMRSMRELVAGPFPRKDSLSPGTECLYLRSFL